MGQRSRQELMAYCLSLAFLALVACSRGGGEENNGGSGNSGTYSISGVVTANGTPLPGVGITLSGAKEISGKIIYTNENGFYTFTSNVSGTLILTPHLPGYTFTPSILTVQMNGGELIGQNFSASQRFNTASLDGDFALVKFHIGGEKVPTTFTNCEIATAKFNGAGEIASTSTYSTNTLGAPLAATGTATYSVSSPGEVVYRTPEALFNGHLNDAGDIVVAADVSDTNRAISVLVKKGGAGYSNSSLTGKYHFTLIGQNNNDPGARAEIGLFDFDGVGNWTLDGTKSTLAGAANVADTRLGTYSVNPDGTFTLNTAPPIRGVIKDTGDALVLSGVDDVNDQLIIYAVRAGTTTFSNASLNGPYFSTSLSMSTGPFIPMTTACYWEINFNGSGGYYAHWQCSPGPRTISTSGYGTYSVSPDGAFRFGVATDTPAPCRISENGKDFVCAFVDSSTGIGVEFGTKMGECETTCEDQRR
jgi:hypothetical protein